MLDIKPISYQEVLKLSSMHKEQVDFKFYPNCHYLGAFLDGMLVGATAWQMVGKCVRYKMSCVLPQYRKQGIFTALWGARETATENIKCDRITGFATKMSAPMYKAKGFVAGKTNKFGVTFFKKEKRR